VIVVDTNVIAYLWVDGPMTASAVALARADDEWVAPPLWRSEMRNLLATLARAGRLTELQALRSAANAESQLRGAEQVVETSDVLTLAVRSGCSAYDCEFVALAVSLGVPFVTCDRKLVRAFPDVARLLPGRVEAES